MALADPQTLTINALPVILPKTEVDKNATGYASNDGTAKFSVSHQYGRRNRTSIRLDTNKISPDPLTDVKAKLGMSVYLLIDRPPVGFTVNELRDAVKALTAWCDAATNANLLKVLGGES